MDPSLIKELTERLKKEQARLRAALGAIAKEGRSFAPAFQEMGDDEEAGQDEVDQLAVNVSSEHQLEEELMRVEHALRKITDGLYGVCEKCGNDIPVERLKAAPEAEYCMEHAE